MSLSCNGGSTGTLSIKRTASAPSPSTVTAVVETLREERFLVLPHPEVAEYMQRKTADYDRWLKGMRRLQSLYGKAD